MTPRALNPDSLHEKLAHMRDLMRRIEALGPMTRVRLEAEAVERAAAERWLTLLVEAAVSINLHVAASRFGRVARDYAESFRLAGEAGLIDTDLAVRLVPSAGTRNALVHGYLDIDLDLLATAFERLPVDYGEYVQQVAAWVHGRVEQSGTEADGGD